MNKAKRFLSLLLAMCLVLGVMPGAALAAEGDPGFTDVKAGDWYYDAVQYVQQKGIMSGTGESAFSPGESTTRGMIVTVLHRLENEPAAAAAAGFPDVAAGQWYAAAVAWASEKGIVNGYDNGNFGPMDPITREQMAAILYRYSQHKGYDTTASGSVASFADGDQVSPYAAEAMAWAVGKGLISGTDGNTLDPKGNATRAQIAAVLMRYDEKVAAGSGETKPADPTKPEDNKKPGATTGGGSVGGGGGGGGTGGGTTTPSKTISGVTLTKEGKKLKVSVAPSGLTAGTDYTVQWFGCDPAEENALEYTISDMDMGAEIYVKVTGAGDYSGSATSSKIQVENTFSSTIGDLKGADENAVAPVKLAGDVTYQNEKGETVTVEETSKVELEVKPAAEKPAKAEVEAVLGDADQQKQAMRTVITAVAKNNAGENVAVPDEKADDLAEEITYSAVDVQLNIVKTETNEEGETETTKTPIHPVGTTTITLSKAALGLSNDVDLNTYSFIATHVNKAGTAQTVAGKVVTVDGAQYIQFELNGLSTIWIGNMPPRTVKFNTDGGSAVAEQKVRFGSTVDTGKVGTPTKAGYLFCGWTYDLAKTPVIYDMTVDAKWVQGVQMPKTRYEMSAFTITNLTATPEDGKYTITADPEATYAADITVAPIVTPYEGAAQYVLSAEAAAAAGTTDKAQFKAIDGAEKITLAPAAVITDGQGKVIAGKTSYYVKWMNDKDETLALEELIIVVEDGKGAAETKVVTREINRGVGTFVPWLTSTDKADAPKWVGYINGDPRRQYTNNSEERQYYLWTRAAFNENFYNTDYNYTDYDVFHLEFTPFTGESYAGKSVSAQARYYYNSSTDSQEKTYPASVSVNSSGKLEVSIPLATFNEPVTSPFIDFTMEVTMGGVTQEIYVGTANPKYQDAGYESGEAADMTELKSLLTQAASSNKQWNITYTGAGDVTLTESLTIPSNVNVDFPNGSFTVGAGGVLTMQSGDSNASYISTNYWDNDAQIFKGREFTVANGGKLLVEDSRSGRYNHLFFATTRAEHITVAKGATVEVKPGSGLAFSGVNYDESSATCTLEAGSQVTVTGSYQGDSHLNVTNFASVSLDGNVKLNDFSYFNVHSASITVGGTIQAVTSYWTNVEFYGDTTITASGKIQMSGQGANLNLQCPLTNKGEISLENGAYGIFTNTGFAQRNDGKISIGSGCSLNLEGTKLVNTGTIEGAGQVFAMLGDDLTDYAANHTGLEYVEVSGTQTPDNYSRYQFTGEPDKEIQVTLYKGEISNEQNGNIATAVKVETENFPEN